MGLSKIEWTDFTFNPWWGCIRVSPGCENCYAETMAKRYGHQVWGPAKTTDRRFFGDQHWSEPLRWNREAEAAGERRRVFCASMADVFETNPVLIEPRARLWELIRATPWLDWLLLTKRPQNFAEMLPAEWLASPAHNVWLGTSVENQRAADERIPLLLQTPAAVRFLSCEPLLGPVDLRSWLPYYTACGASRDEKTQAALDDLFRAAVRYMGGSTLHWVIAGGESGPKARPMHPDWARSLRDQCQAAGVAFHFKQWGEYGPTPEPRLLTIGGDDVVGMARVGKHAAGRTLDGRTWDEFPTPARELMTA
jgi:protein gp37